MLHKIIGTAGFTMLLLGAGGMDSPSMVVPGRVKILEVNG